MHRRSVGDGGVWLAGEQRGFRRKSFICVSWDRFLKHLLASHHTLFMLIPRFPSSFLGLFSALSQFSGDEAIPVGVGRNVGMMTGVCVCVCLREVYDTHQ